MIGVIGAQVNSSIMIEEVGNWKFDKINTFKVDVSGESIEKVRVEYQNISGVSINEINFSDRGQNFYIGELFIEGSDKGSFNINVTVFRQGEIESFSKNIIVDDKTFFDEIVSFIDDNLSGFYFIVIIGFLILLFILFLLASERIARRDDK